LSTSYSDAGVIAGAAIEVHVIIRSLLGTLVREAEADVLSVQGGSEARDGWTGGGGA